MNTDEEPTYIALAQGEKFNASRGVTKIFVDTIRVYDDTVDLAGAQVLMGYPQKRSRLVFERLKDEQLAQVRGIPPCIRAQIDEARQSRNPG